MKVIESILKAVLEADEENPMELMGPKDMPKVELFSPTNPGGPMTAPHRVALHVGFGNRNEWVVHYEDMSGGQSHGYYQGFYTYDYNEALDEFKARCKKIGVDPAQSEQHLAEATEDDEAKHFSGPETIGDWLVSLGFEEEAGWSKETRSYCKYAAPNERWIIWPNHMETRQIAGWYSIDHEFKTPRGWEKADHRLTLKGDEELQRFVRMLSCVREASEDDLGGEWKELMPYTTADEILQHMPPDFVRAYQTGEEAEWRNSDPSMYDWVPEYDDDNDEEGKNPWTESIYYPEYRTEGGKLYVVWMSGDRDGNHDFADEAEVGTPDADQLEKTYGYEGWSESMKRYWAWVAQRGEDPLGYIFNLPQVEVEKKWIASFMKDGGRLRCTAIRRLGAGQGKVDFAEAWVNAQHDEDWKKALEYLLVDQSGISEASEQDVLNEGGKWNAQGLLIIRFSWTDKEAAANQKEFIVNQAKDALSRLLKDERKRKRRAARRRKRGIQDALEDELMGAGENELADLLLNTVDGQTLRFKFIPSYPDQSPLGPTTAVRVSIEGGQVLGTVYPGTYVQHHPEQLGDTIHIYGISVTKDNAMVLSNWVKERLAMWNELGEALDDDFDVKDVAGGEPLENVLAKIGFTKDQTGVWTKDLTGTNKIYIRKLGDPEDPNSKNWEYRSVIAGVTFGPYNYSAQDMLSQLIHGGYVGQEDVAEWHWHRAWMPHPQGGQYEPKGRKYWESEEDFKDLMPDPPIDHWLYTSGFKQLNEFTWMKSFDAQGRSRAMVWKLPDGLYELKTYFENYEFKHLRTRGTEKDILATLERMTIDSPGLWPKNWREESLSHLAKKAIKERLTESDEEGEWKDVMPPSAEDALERAGFKRLVTNVFPNGVWVKKLEDQHLAPAWLQAEQREPDRWNLASFVDYTCIASRDLSGAELAREMVQHQKNIATGGGLEEADEVDDWKELVHEVQVERWVFTTWELRHPETCRRDDEFLTAESYDPYGMAIMMYRDGNATNRTADGTAGVDEKAEDWANEQETYIKDKHSREDEEEDMFADNWRDVYATWNGKFAGWADQKPPQVIESEAELTPLLPELVQAAQEAYDAWAQDEQGEDPELGVGGICQDVAEAMSGVLNGHGIDASTVDNQGMGDQHVWVVAKLSDGVYIVDIPPGVYETGSGYVWKKRPGVVFSPEHIIVDRIDTDPAKFEQYIGESEDDDLVKDMTGGGEDLSATQIGERLLQHGFTTMGSKGQDITLVAKVVKNMLCRVWPFSFPRKSEVELINQNLRYDHPAAHDYYYFYPDGLFQFLAERGFLAVQESEDDDLIKDVGVGHTAEDVAELLKRGGFQLIANVGVVGVGLMKNIDKAQARIWVYDYPRKHHIGINTEGEGGRWHEDFYYFDTTNLLDYLRRTGFLPTQESEESDDFKEVWKSSGGADIVQSPDPDLPNIYHVYANDKYVGNIHRAHMLGKGDAWFWFADDIRVARTSRVSGPYDTSREAVEALLPVQESDDGEEWKELVHAELVRPTLLTDVPVGWHFRDLDGIEKIKDADTDRKTNNPLYTVYPVNWTVAQIKSWGRHRSKMSESDEDEGGWKEVMSEPWQQMIQDGGWKLISFKKRHWVPLVMRRIKNGKRQIIQWSSEDRGYRLTVDGSGVIEGRLIDCLQTAEKLDAPKE